MNNPILVCHKLAKKYTDGASVIEVLKDISFEVQPSETIAVIGNSGSGKSTLLHLLGGLDQPSSGKVEINGKDLATLSEKEKCQLRNRYLGFVYQFHHLLPEFSALENVSMPLIIRGGLPRTIIEKASHLLEMVGLKERLQHRLGQLSGGERQRVAIARALVTDPLCVLADEPTGNLDPYNAERVLQLFIELQETFQTSIIMVTHDPAIAAKAQRTLKIENGSLVALT